MPYLPTLPLLNAAEAMLAALSRGEGIDVARQNLEQAVLAADRRKRGSVSFQDGRWRVRLSVKGHKLGVYGGTREEALRLLESLREERRQILLDELLKEVEVDNRHPAEVESSQ